MAYIHFKIMMIVPLLFLYTRVCCIDMHEYKETVEVFIVSRLHCSDRHKFEAK
jgi:hypothetical protein